MELFARPVYFLYFLAALCGLLAVIFAGGKLRNRVIFALFGPKAWQKMTEGAVWDRKLRNAFFLSGVFFLFAALAVPQWGTEIVEAQGSFAQTVIAVDVSASMRARDLKPDRLENAKSMLNMLITNLKDERIGIIAFTSQAYVQCPITTDEDALKYFVSSLRPDMLPVPGTSLAAPVKLAAHMLAKYPGQKALILLTDGEDHSEKELKEAEETAQKNGIRIITIGIGTPEGELIPARTDRSGKILEYKKDKEGKTVVSKLDEKTLASLAQATSGVYIKYTTPSQVAAKVEASIKTLDRTDSKITSRAGYKNRYQIPLALAVLCLSLWLLWPRREKETAPAGQNDAKKVK